MLASRAALHEANFTAEETQKSPRAVWDQVQKDFPVPCDWIAQDHGLDFSAWFDNAATTDLENTLIRRVLEELGSSGDSLRAELNDLTSNNVSPNDPRRLQLYVKACEQRRALRLRTLLEKSPRIVFTKHYNIGGSHYAYTEGLSDAQNERHFIPGASLCLLEMDGLHGRVRTLIDDRRGVIRDPAVSWDGKRILFSWKKSDREDDYHLYELDLATSAIRQLTSGLGFADYEGAYLPNGDLLFNSTRCVQTVDCWWTEVSNLYTCDKEGRFLRRLGFDQVHTNYPTILDDGRVSYTRWDYNDRGQIFPQALFQMNPDGTGQTELYGNNSWFPTTILHARGIPGTEKLVAIATGHHSDQRGKLILIDPGRGRQEAEGVQLIAPVRETPAVHVDSYGQDGGQFQYPWPLSETEFLVAYDPVGGGNRVYRRPYGIYLMMLDGRRELLAWDPAISCNQPVPLAPRPVPPLRAGAVDYRKTAGTYYLQDLYRGPGLAGVARGTIKRLRVVALEYRAAGIGQNYSDGPPGAALSCTPPSIGNGCWDVKVVLGEAKVHDDGSACFTVPARTPVYFQALDEKGRAVQTMRSWSTLQPGETISCVGCHESKNDAPPVSQATTLAAKAGPRPLAPFHGPPRGFSFIREIQPILDRKCISCHTNRANHPLLPKTPRTTSSPAVPNLAKQSLEPDSKTRVAFSLLGAQTVEPRAGRKWSDAYLALTNAYPHEMKDRGTLKGKPNELVSWITAQSVPSMLPPRFAGSTRSRLLTLLEAGHYDVKLTQEELEKIACWIDLGVPYCGDYTEANAWSDEETRKYEHFLAKRKRMEAIEAGNLNALIRSRRNSVATAAGSGQ